MDLKALTVTGKGYSKIYSENPFYEEPVPRAFYHPSKEKQISATQKKLGLSPDRPGGSASRGQQQGPEAKFLAGSHAIKPLAPPQKHAPQSPPSANFNESWPESERPSSPSFQAADDMNKLDSVSFLGGHAQVQQPSASDRFSTAQPSVHQMQQPAGEISTQQEKMLLQPRSEGKEKERRTERVTGEQGSVLQRYIDRFRNAAPMSREERIRVEGDNKKREFWWLEADPPTPASTSTPKEEGRSLALTSQGRSGGLTVENLKQRDQLDVATMQLQEKADKLLSSAHSMGSSEPVVSTDGLGSTGSDITGSSFSEPAVRPAFVQRPFVEDPRRWASKMGSAAKDSEGDILYKWRVQRKLEQARDCATVPCSAKPAPKTQAEQEVCSRLAAFRERLLQRPTVAAYELQQARVERAVKETQTQMDTGVQTSPPKTPTWSFTRKADTCAQADAAVSTQEVKDAGNFYQHSAQSTNSVQTGRQKAQADHQAGGRFRPHLCERSPSDGSVSEVPPSRQSDVQGSRHVSSSEESRYRQFLTAEKPHVDDAGDKNSKQPRGRLLERDEHDTFPDKNRRERQQTRGDDMRQSVSSSSERSVTPVELPFQVSVGVVPGASGDATSVSDSQNKKRSFSEQKHSGQTKDNEADSSDGSSQHGKSKMQSKRVTDSAHSDSDHSDSRHSDRDRRHELSRNRRKERNLSESSQRHPADNELARKETNQSMSGEAPNRLHRQKGEGFHNNCAGGSKHSREKIPAHPENTRSDHQPRSQSSKGERSKTMPPPQHSSSPARSSLTAAIGQVVRDRLFDVSASVMSSVDSFASSFYQSPQPRGNNTNSQVLTSSAETAYESDGEFESDPLLQLLRQQRHGYEMKLRQLDTLLAQFETQDGP